MTPSRQGQYGIDAPGVVVFFLVTGGLFFILALSFPTAWGFVFPGISMLATSFLMIFSSKVGKLRELRRLLDQELPLTAMKQCWTPVVAAACY